MTKKKSRIRGRGNEIVGRGVNALFSDTPPPDHSSESPAEETEAELESMLEVEVHDAVEGASTGEETSEAPSPLATSETLPEPAPIHEDMAIAGEGVSLTEDELMKAIDIPLGEAPETKPTTSKTERPKSEPSSVPSPLSRPPASVPPPSPQSDYEPVPPRPRVRIGGQLTEVVVTPGELDNDSVRPQSPFTQPSAPLVEDSSSPQRSSEDEARILATVDPEQLAELHRRIDHLYREVPKKISNRPDLTAQILGMLRQARTILVEHPYDYIEAEYKIQQAYAIYNRVENAERWGRHYGWRVFWFEVITFFLLLFSFLGLLAFGNDFSNFLARLFGASEATQGLLTAVGFWATFVWGGIGGVVGAMYTLWTHVSERQDFERQHVMWYIAQPIMGLILGGVTFLIINTGLLSLQSGQAAATALREEVQLFPSLIAFIAGFRPQFIFGLLVKIIKLINPTTDES
ncbi:MAG: hypothetical protein GXP38_00315 [Chloroflexi bacterium]|nr:hypothetical protein [Chloroflexota bacterium]